MSSAGSSASSLGQVFLAGQSTNAGRLDLGTEAITWYSSSSDRRIVLPLADLSAAEWYDMGRACQLWLYEAAGAALTRFDGLRLTDKERVAAHLAAGSRVKLANGLLSSAGTNYGTATVKGGQLRLLDASGRLVAPIPLSSVSQAAYPGKGDVLIQFFDEDTAEREDECLIEMRLHVPAEHKLEGAEEGVEMARKKAADKVRVGDDKEEAEESIKAAGEDSANVLHALVAQGAGVAGLSGDAVAEFDEDVGQFLVPRGRYAIELYPTFMRLVGKTFEFKVAYKSIARMFMLPKPSPTVPAGEETRFLLVVSLDDPLRHGNQRHPHLIMQLDRVPYSTDLNISDADLRSGRYEGLVKDSKTVSGDLHKVVGHLLKHVTGKPVLKPGAFRSSTGHSALRCSCKGETGLLYFLDKSLMFVHKPALWVRYADLEKATVESAAGRTWTLDLYIKTGGGTDKANRATFQGLDGHEQSIVHDFLTANGVRVVRAVSAAKVAAASFVGLDGADGSEEEDGGSGRKRARGGAGAHAAGGGDHEDDEDEEDDDFEADDDDDDDDDDSEDSEDSEDSDDAPKKKAKSKSSASKAKPKSSSKSSSASKRRRRGGSDSD